MRYLYTLILVFVCQLSPVSAQSSVSFYREFNGSLDFITTAGTFRDRNNNNNANASSLRNSAYGDLTIPAGAEIGAAFLYWAASGSPDNNVTFDGNNINSLMK